MAGAGGGAGWRGQLFPSSARRELNFSQFFPIVCSSALCNIMKVFEPSVVKLAVSKASISKQSAGLL